MSSKDLLGLVSLGEANKVTSPTLGSISNSNEQQIDLAFAKSLKFAPKNIAFLGISFKEGTDDLRFSPNLKLAQRLFSENINIKVHDQNVFATIQDGINDLEVRNSAGSIYSEISDNLDSVIENADLIIIVEKCIIFKSFRANRYSHT